jgi:hypothetical protein
MSTYHEWGDDFDWEGLGNAGHIIWWLCTKIGRIGIHIKEKYGTLRCSSYFWDGSLFGLCYPGYVYNQFPKWLWNIDCSYIKPFVRFLKFPTWIMWKYQKAIYMLAYYIAMKKYPHIREEICVDSDGYEMIIGGRKIHDKHWRTYEPISGKDDL